MRHAQNSRPIPAAQRRTMLLATSRSPARHMRMFCRCMRRGSGACARRSEVVATCAQYAVRARVCSVRASAKRQRRRCAVREAAAVKACVQKDICAAMVG